MKKMCVSLLAATTLALVAASAQAATVEQQLDQISQLVTNQEPANPTAPQNSEVSNNNPLSDEALKDAVDSNPIGQLGESNEIDEKLFDTFPMPVPETGTSAMMIFGAGLIAFVARRRNNNKNS